MKKIQDAKGFSLVELMIAVGISVLIMASVFIFLRTSQEHLQAMGTKMTIQDSVREGLYKMLQELRLSSPDQVTINGDGSSITFKIPDSEDPLGEDYRVDWDNAREIVYELGGENNSQLIRTDQATAETTVMANDVVGLTFEGDAAEPRVVTVILEVQREMASGRWMTSTPLQIRAQAEVRNS